MQNKLTIIGAGLAGSEAAWQAVKRGISVDLYEMRPTKNTPAHQTDYFAELVCSNSLRANHLQNAAGLLKEELRQLDSLIISLADQYSLPAGRALAVDREKFAAAVTRKLQEHPLINVHNCEVTKIPQDRIAIIATGPLTSTNLAAEIKEITGEDYLYFYDAAAPIIATENIDYDRVFRYSRYQKGEGDYLNCPMNKEEYESFWGALIAAEVHKPHDFEEDIYFEGCLPIEVIASRGIKTLLFGPLKPVGLIDPKTGKKPYAVVQLRQDNSSGTLYNLVGFQTRLKWKEQDKVIKMIPGLEEVEIVRYGVMHRNTFINSPQLLKSTFQFRQNDNIFFAGQLTGVEGYIESTASGLMAGINAVNHLEGGKEVVFPETTAHGALSRYISDPIKDKLQPMNINFGLLPQLQTKIRDKWERKGELSKRALADLNDFIKSNL